MTTTATQHAEQAERDLDAVEQDWGSLTESGRKAYLARRTEHLADPRNALFERLAVRRLTEIGADSHDFVEVSRTFLREMLAQAFEAGRNQALSRKEA